MLWLEKNKNIAYTPNKDMAVQLFKSYVDETCYLSEELRNPNHLELLEQDEVYGVAIYDMFIKQIEMGPIDGRYYVRPFHILINYMEVYLYILNLFCDDSLLHAKVDELVKMATLNWNLYVKYRISGRKKEQLLNDVISLKNQEIDFINEIMRNV